MDSPDSKPFGQHSVQRGPPLSKNCINSTLADRSSQHHLISLHDTSLSDRQLHNSVVGTAVHEVAYSENHLRPGGIGTDRLIHEVAYSENHLHPGGIGRDRLVHKVAYSESHLHPGGIGSDRLIQSSDLDKEHDNGISGHSQRSKRGRTDCDGVANHNGYTQSSFRPLPLVQNSVSTDVLSLQLHLFSQKHHQPFHQNLHCSHQSPTGSFANLDHCSFAMPLQDSCQSPVHKCIPSLPRSKMAGQIIGQENPSIQQSSTLPVITVVPSSQSSEKGAFYDPSRAADPAARRLAVQSWGKRPLAVVDRHLWLIMEKEKIRQCNGIELVASENFTSQAVIEALGSHLTNKYSEGMPGARLYSGNENIDLIETLCVKRALKAFHLDPKFWGVNVQPYSCTSANFAVYTALLQPNDRIMGLDSPSGGHLSHGYYTFNRKKVSGASIFFETFPYKVDSTGYIDFLDLERIAIAYKPKLLICGASAYPREWDYAKFRDIASKCGAILMFDMAQISGLVAAQQCSSPFQYCDIVTSTTHKSLRGPRGGMIFYRRGQKYSVATHCADHYDFEAKINFAVSHSVQGGPHNNRTAALAVALLLVDTPDFKAYIHQVLKNAKALAATLQRRNCKLITGGTDNHLLLWDLRPYKLTGSQYEKVCELCGITLNKNALFGDSGPKAPGGVRLGTPAMTSRGCCEDDFETIAEFLWKALQIAHKVQTECGDAQEFYKGLQDNKEIHELRESVENFSSSFGMPGFDIPVLRCSELE